MRTLVNIDVPELGPAIAFYSAALGLTLKRRLDDDVAELAGASVSLFLLKKAAHTPTGPDSNTRHYARHWTPVHLDFVVEDIAQAAQRAVDAGATQESVCIQWKGSKCITFSDPFGHGFCLIEFADGESGSYR